MEDDPRGIACLSADLHPGFGLFHSDRQGNSAFIFDMTEAGRPTVDQVVLDFIRKHQFAEGDCYETREGFCRLDPKITERLTKWMPMAMSSSEQVSPGEF